MVKCGERQLEGGWGVCEISVGLPMNNGTMEAVEYICVNMWCMLDWIMLDWTISSPHSGNNIALTEIGYWGFALPGNELGLLWWDFDALTTWLQIRNSSSNSTESQMPYLTHEMSPYLRFSLPPSSVISILFSPHPPALSDELVSQQTTEQQDAIPDLPQFWMVTYSPHAPALFIWSNNSIVYSLIHYSSTFPNLPPHSTYTPFPPSQLTTLPPFPAHLPLKDKKMPPKWQRSFTR